MAWLTHPYSRRGIGDILHPSTEYSLFVQHIYWIIVNCSILGVKPAADSRENKSSTDANSGRASTSSGTTCYNRDGHRTTTQKKFQGSNSNLLGHVFTTGSTCAGQINQFSKTDEQIQSVVGQKYNPYVLCSLEAGKLFLPEEPVANADDKGRITDAEKVQYSELLDKWIMKKDEEETWGHST